MQQRPDDGQPQAQHEAFHGGMMLNAAVQTLNTQYQERRQSDGDHRQQAAAPAAG